MVNRTDPSSDPGADPVRARRARIARAVRIARQAGYAMLLVSIVSFVVAAATDFSSLWVGLTIGALAATCAILPVPIVLGYGIRAAEREDRRQQ
jgi:hypothetical protein